MAVKLFDGITGNAHSFFRCDVTEFKYLQAVLPILKLTQVVDKINKDLIKLHRNPINAR